MFVQNNYMFIQNQFIKQIIIMITLLVTFTSCSKSSDNNKTIDKTDTIPETTTRFNVFNKGVSGNTSQDMLNRSNDILPYKPNLVIIMCGTNDVTGNLSLTTYQDNLTTMVAKFKTAGSQVLLMSPLPRGTDVITYPDPLNQKTDAIVDINKALSIKLKCYYLDMNKAFKDAGTPNATATSMLLNAANNGQGDGLHPTSEGLLFIAKTVYDYIKADMPYTTYKVIVCFGDSITEAPGNTANYPNQLSLLLNK
jgi:lysophospholipase L1-like esterase